MAKRKEEEEEEKNDQANFLENDEDAGMDIKHVQMHEQATKIKTIEWIQIGKYKWETWYFSPYPEGYHHIDWLYVWHYCLSFFKWKEDMTRHASRWDIRHPPGDEIYRDDKVAVFEVDGQRESIYWENLCYLSKLFLDHKTLTYEVDPFLFYWMWEYDEEGYQIGGYFSKEKEFSKDIDPEVAGKDKIEKERNFNNLSCILVLPFHQRKGYGKFLISFSYELSILEGKQGTPERPLSDLGHKTYSSWWTWKLLTFLKQYTGNEISIQFLACKTGILQSDIIQLFESFKILRYHQGDHYFVITDEFIDELIKRAGDPGHQVITENIHWTKYEWYNYS